MGQKKRGPAPKKEEQSSKKQKKSPVVKKKSPEEIAMNDLSNAIENEKNFFPEPDLFSKLVPMILKDMKEDRQKTTCALIDELEAAVGKAHADLKKHLAQSKLEVEKFDDISAQKSHQLNQLEELQKQHEERKSAWEEALKQAKEELKIAEDEKETEESRLSDYKDKYNEIGETLETIDGIFDKHIRAHIVGQTEITKKIKEDANKAFKKLCGMDLWQNESTLLLHTLPFALFKDSLERTEFERETLNFVMKKKEKDDERLNYQLENEKPDETKQDELREVFAQKEEALERIKTSLKECDKELKATIKNVKDMKVELSDLPKLFDKKQEQLNEVEQTIDEFGVEIIANFNMLVQRTNIVEETEEKEEMKGEDEDTVKTMDASVEPTYEETMHEMHGETAEETHWSEKDMDVNVNADIQFREYESSHTGTEAVEAAIAR